jgi:hypothetical protein
MICFVRAGCADGAGPAMREMSRTATRSLMLRFMIEAHFRVTRVDVVDSMKRALIRTD